MQKASIRKAASAFISPRPGMAYEASRLALSISKGTPLWRLSAYPECPCPDRYISGQDGGCFWYNRKRMPKPALPDNGQKRAAGNEYGDRSRNRQGLAQAAVKIVTDKKAGSKLLYILLIAVTGGVVVLLIPIYHGNAENRVWRNTGRCGFR